MKIECLCHRYSGKGYAKTANYISNPNVEFQGAKTGSDLANNAKVLIETRFRSASVGDESAIISEYSIQCMVKIFWLRITWIGYATTLSFLTYFFKLR